MLRRLAIGIVKGLCLGGLVGALFQFVLNLPVIATEWTNYLLYGALGALTGAIAGRAPWKPGAWIEGVLRGLFGVAVGCGLYALGSHFIGNPPVLNTAQPLAHQPMLFAPMLALVYATLVELDNTGGSETETPSAGLRVDADKLLASIPDEDEAPAAKSSARRKGA